MSRPIKVGVGDDVRELSAGERTSFELGAHPAREQEVQH
jgi:hypothetical protein